MYKYLIKQEAYMDDKTKTELYRRANMRLEATLDSIKDNIETLTEIHSNLYIIFHLLHVANQDIKEKIFTELD